MNGIIYCRVSSKEQVDGTSLESQEAACRDYAHRNGIEVVKVFIERGESAKFADRRQAPGGGINVIGDCGHNLECDINSDQIGELPDSSNCNSATVTSENRLSDGFLEEVPDFLDLSSATKILPSLAADGV